MSRQVDQQQQPSNFDADLDGEEVVYESDPGSGSAPWVLDNEPEHPALAQQQQPQQAPVQQQAPAQQPPTTQAQPQGSQYEIRLKTGHIFRGATPDDAAAAAQAHFDQLSSRQPTQYQQPQAPQYQSPAPQAPPDWNDENFYRSFATNPREAMASWARHYFGVDDPAEALTTSYSVSTQVSDRIAVADFLSTNVDFPASPEAGALLVKRLEADSVDLTTWNLEVAYRQLVREGVLVPLVAEAPPQQQQRQPQQPTYRQDYQQPQPQAPFLPQSRGAGAPPSFPGGANGGANGGGNLGDRELSVDEFESLSADQMKSYIVRRGQMRGR